MQHKRHKTEDENETSRGGNTYNSSLALKYIGLPERSSHHEALNSGTVMGEVLLDEEKAPVDRGRQVQTGDAKALLDQPTKLRLSVADVLQPSRRPGVLMPLGY